MGGAGLVAAPSAQKPHVQTVRSKDILNMNDSATRFLKDESGASAIEYALLVAGMAAAVIAMTGAISEALVDWAKTFFAGLIT